MHVILDDPLQFVELVTPSSNENTANIELKLQNRSLNLV